MIREEIDQWCWLEEVNGRCQHTVGSRRACQQKKKHLTIFYDRQQRTHNKKPQGPLSCDIWIPFWKIPCGVLEGFFGRAIPEEPRPNPNVQTVLWSDARHTSNWSEVPLIENSLMPSMFLFKFINEHENLIKLYGWPFHARY